MSGNVEQRSGADPWPSKQTNSVEANDGVSDDYDERVHERVLEFIEEYPDLAELPLSRTHGRKLRRIVTEAEWTEEWVDPSKPTENAFQVTELVKREAATWADALSAFLTAHLRYDGLMARFANDEGDEFEIPLADAWGEEYSKKQYARACALQRQMAGGERPSGGVAVAAWDDPATAMITLTGSSIPDGTRVPPVEHTDALHDSFSYDGVRDTLRNTMEYHLGLDSEEWGYWLQAEPHGMAATESDGDPGPNTCYSHLHVGVYFDRSALTRGLADDLNAIGGEFERVIDKHVEVCEFASFSAHDYTQIEDYEKESDGCISLNANVENMGSYMASYMGGYTESLMDKPIEYLAWGAIYWSAARRRTSRSTVVNDAIAADACEQRAENPNAGQTDSHGETVTWNDGNGHDVVCSECNSGWQIDQNRLDEPAFPDEPDEPELNHAPLEPLSFSDRWKDATGAFSTGESPLKAQIRSKVLEYVEVHGMPSSVPEMLGELSINPCHQDLVIEALDGETEPSVETFRRPVVGSSWRLDAIVEADGEEHPPAGGGIDVKPLHLPTDHLLEETRLRHGLQRGEKWRCGKCNFATATDRTMAWHLLDHGLETPEAADRVLKPENCHGELRPCLRYSGDKGE